jgi:predicted nuclease of predicted toxin-antitoxin system
VVRELIAARHDVVWVGDVNVQLTDAEVLAQAYTSGRVLVTLDKDFGELAIVRQQPHSGILRLVNFSAREQASVCARVLEMYGNELQSGAIVTAEPGRVRVRPATTQDR